MPISRFSPLRCALLMVCGLFLSEAGRAADMPTGPQAVVETFDADLLASMREAPRSGPKGRFAVLEPSMARAFDMSGMARHILKSRWKRLTDDQKTRYVAAFARFETAQYSAWFDTYTGQSFRIGPVRPAKGGGMMVSSVMAGGGGPDLVLDYLVAQGDDGSWKIVDVTYAGWMSTVERRSSEFVDITKRLGIEALIARLEAGSQAALAQADNRAAPHLLQQRTELWSLPLPAID